MFYQWVVPIDGRSNPWFSDNILAVVALIFQMDTPYEKYQGWMILPYYFKDFRLS